MEQLVYSIVVLVISALLAGWFGYLWLGNRRRLVTVEQERNEIEKEERRMFTFLHGLGGALQEDSSPPSMHRYVVNGVATVVGAEAGILYLYDGETNKLVPVFQTKKVAAVVPVPREVLEIKDRTEAERSYRSYIRLSPLEKGSTFIGKTMESKGVVYAEKLIEHEFYEGIPNYFQENICVLAAPLIYGKKKVGVLAMVRNSNHPFSRNDRDVFASVAEQGAFALGSAIIHADASEKRRLESELQQASAIQRILLPRTSPELSDYDVAASFQAARIVSGDYYDYVQVDEDRYGVVIGDVCGKGIAASLIMAMCRSNLRAHSKENLSPAAVLHEVNRSIFPDIREDMFVSFLYMILERGSNEVTIARAGHETPLVYRRATRTVEYIEVPGMAAGVDPGPVFKRSVKDHRFTMETGDIAFLYTDGIIEMVDRDGDEFGIDKLKEVIEGMENPEAEAMIELIMSEVKKFGKGMAQTDDITLIAVEKR